jgi:hypothetical protein
LKAVLERFQKALTGQVKFAFQEPIYTWEFIDSIQTVDLFENSIINSLNDGKKEAIFLLNAIINESRQAIEVLYIHPFPEEISSEFINEKLEYALFRGIEEVFSNMKLSGPGEG